MSLTAYIRYDNKGRIVPGGPIVTSVKPKVGDWVAISDVLVTTTPPNYKLRAFVRYINRIGGQNNSNKYVAGSLILQHDAPQDGNWKEVYFIKPCESCNTTTTTTTTCVPFINSIIISDGSLSTTNGTYIRTNPLDGFTQVGGPSFIFNASGDGWYINSGAGNAAKNTSTLGTGSWVPWEPGNSSGIIAEYIYQQCTTTTSTTSSSTTSTTSTTTTVTPTTTTTTTTDSFQSIILYYNGRLCGVETDWSQRTPGEVKCDWLEILAAGDASYGGGEFLYYASAGFNVGTQLYSTVPGNPPVTFSGTYIYYLGGVWTDAKVFTVTTGIISAIYNLGDLPVCGPYVCPGNFITTEGSDPIITEGGDNLIIE